MAFVSISHGRAAPPRVTLAKTPRPAARAEGDRYAVRLTRMALTSEPHGAEEDDVDSFDFPAAVLCAKCRSPDCPGCAITERPPPGSVPWEVGTTASWTALWSTARSSTVDGESFFAKLPSGRLGAALFFASLCELLAIGSVAVVLVPLAYALSPAMIHSLWETGAGGRVGLWMLSAVVGLSAVMVLLHLLWGAGLELGLRLQGHPVRLSWTLRYALYACGWDLLTSPFGLVTSSITRGLAQGLRDVRAGVRIPRHATRAYLLLARCAPEPSARGALRTAALITGTVVVMGVVGALALGVLLSLS